ncbi:hypothetical protein [uncultured Sphingomonas sp.]|uniref:hypothetical protein n=1 Tax=uncultured Sphingomonas sp. TaxID=158754 RepID=UPI0035CAE2B0
MPAVGRAVRGAGANAPAEIDNLPVTHADVVDVAVTGAPDDEVGAEVVQPRA